MKLTSLIAAFLISIGSAAVGQTTRPATTQPIISQAEARELRTEVKQLEADNQQLRAEVAELKAEIASQPKSKASIARGKATAKPNAGGHSLITASSDLPQQQVKVGMTEDETDAIAKNASFTIVKKKVSETEDSKMIKWVAIIPNHDEEDTICWLTFTNGKVSAITIP